MVVESETNSVANTSPTKRRRKKKEHKIPHEEVEAVQFGEEHPSFGSLLLVISLLYAISLA